MSMTVLYDSSRIQHADIVEERKLNDKDNNTKNSM